MSTKLLVAGAINTDLVVNVDRAPNAGETITGRSFAIHSGGKGANQAVAAARAGGNVVMLGGVGDDQFGRERLRDLASDGIDVSHVGTVGDAASGVALITVEVSGENRISYVPGATLKVLPEQCQQVIETVHPAMILAANELSHACNQQLFGFANAHGIPVIFNAAPFTREAVDLLPLVDVLIVNRGEAAALLGQHAGDHHPEALASGLRDLGVREIVITLGSEGVFAMHGDDGLTLSARKVDVVDTTGAGDTFCGAFAARMLEGSSFREAVAHANIAGALATTRAGAQSSIPTREDVARIAG